MSPTFFGKVVDGRITFNNKEALNNHVSRFNGKEVEVIIKRRTRNVTREQYGYLYVLYNLVSEHTGYSVDEIDGVMKRRHLTVNRDSPFEWVKNKSQCTSQEISDFINKVRMDCAEHGIITPGPDGG